MNLTNVKTSEERLEAGKRTKYDWKFGNFLMHHPLKIIDNIILLNVFLFSQKAF